MVEAGDCARFKHLMGLEGVSRDGDAVIKAGGKDVPRCLLTHVVGTTRQLSRSWNARGLHSTTRTRRTICENPVGTRKRSRGEPNGYADIRHEQAAW